MYSEKSFKNYIFWIQVKRLFVIILLSIIGAALGIVIGKFLESTIQVSQYNNGIIAGTTIVFFLIANLSTASIGKEVQDAYWKIAVLRKLTVIQKDIEYNNMILNGKKITTDYKYLASGIEVMKETIENEKEDNSILPIPANKKNKHDKSIEKDQKKKDRKNKRDKKKNKKTHIEKSLEEKIEALDDIEEVEKTEINLKVEELKNISKKESNDDLSIEKITVKNDDNQESNSHKRKTIKKPEAITSK